MDFDNDFNCDYNSDCRPTWLAVIHSPDTLAKKQKTKTRGSALVTAMANACFILVFGLNLVSTRA